MKQRKSLRECPMLWQGTRCRDNSALRAQDAPKRYNCSTEQQRVLIGHFDEWSPIAKRYDVRTAS